ncbi:hypothetical protein ABGB17_18855 [Sphaerisporangium sp. B11E5]|uniref:hypothetical protein n=1 Tax=Sphaerisporangium sp. B11E5 TaxID=3153563 RepID=UPI00325EF3C9
MPLEEKRAWIRLVVSVVGYVVYLVVVLGRAGGRPLAEVAYAGVLLWTVGGGIVAAMLIEIVLGIVRPGSLVKDERDREIERFGEHTGQAFLVVGGVAAMLMAMAEWEGFWIANVIYLCFVLSAVLAAVAKIFLYRKGFPQW